MNIVSAAAVVDILADGPIILIMNQYAQCPDAEGQASFLMLVVQWDDNLQAHDGQQIVVTPKCYVISLNVQSGLYFMDMIPAFDTELDKFPMIHMTLDVPWNPDDLSSEYFNTARPEGDMSSYMSF